MTTPVGGEELEALRAEVTALRKAVALLALLNGETALVLSEVIRRLDRHASPHSWLAPEDGRGLKTVSLRALRQRVDQSLDDIFIETEKLLSSNGDR